MDKHDLVISRLSLVYKDGGLESTRKELDKLKKEDRIRKFYTSCKKMEEEVSTWNEREKRLNFVNLESK